MEDQNGNKTQYSYDLAGRRTEETFADGTTKTYQYDLAGRLTESTDQNGSVITSSYDAAGRLTERSVDRAEGVIGTTEQTFSYDEAGRLLSSTDNNDPNDSGDDAGVSKSYDALGRTTTETVNGYTVQSSYTGSRRTEIEYPNGTQVTRSYDAAGNLDAVKRDGSPVVDYSYDSRNQVTGATFGNGVELTNQHDELGRMTDREYNKDGNMIAGFAYGYDEVGNKLYQEDLRDPDQSELYGYDSRDRLTDWDRGELNGDKDGIVTMQADQTWNLDPVGNWDLTTTDGTADDRDHNVVNELIERYDGGLNLIYDDNGNLIEDDEYEYAYDAFNRLKTVTRKSDDAVIATCTYDTQNRRITKTVTNSTGFNGTTEYVYDGWQVVEERDGSGSVEKTYTYGSYIDEPVTMTNMGSTGGRTYYYHTNNLYNVRALTDEDGDVVERYRYSAYGEPTILDEQGNERQQSAVGNPYMFQGRRLDPETGLYYLRNRMMSSELGRFLQRDPVGYTDSLNLFVFVGNNPLVKVDSKGLGWINPRTVKCTLLWMHPNLVVDWHLFAVAPGLKVGGLGGRYHAYPLCCWRATVRVTWLCPKCCKKDGIKTSVHLGVRYTLNTETTFQVKSKHSISLGGPPIPVGGAVQLLTYFGKHDTKEAVQNCWHYPPRGLPRPSEIRDWRECVEGGIW
ncbi:MAG: RHS repeat-associated core domain-containing protein [Candidatus Brocadiia bacterium]